MSARRATWISLAGVLLPELAHACAVCGGGNPANRFAFFASTIALSLIPLTLFAGGFLWLRKRLLSKSADEFRDRDEALPATSDTHRPSNPHPIA